MILSFLLTQVVNVLINVIVITSNKYKNTSNIRALLCCCICDLYVVCSFDIYFIPGLYN